MSELRCIFEKTGAARYLSHLDVMRTFIRALNRAEVPVEYSQGFNPHPKLSIAHPLPVGAEGMREVLDVTLIDDAECGLTVEKFNAVLPDGLKGVDLYTGGESVKSIAFTTYRLEYIYDSIIPDISMLNAWFAKDEIPVLKKSKKGDRTINLRPLFTTFDVRDCKGNTLYIDLEMPVGEAPLNPRYLAQSLAGTQLAPDFVRARRLGFFTKAHTEFR